MASVKNFLFIMYDQLRADYLSCYGHPSIGTPTIDALARRGVRFTRAYCQSPVCAPSRMSFYCVFRPIVTARFGNVTARSGRL